MADSDFAIMADRTIHYEAAFEAFLRSRGIPYVAVDEAKKALFADAKLKSLTLSYTARTVRICSSM